MYKAYFLLLLSPHKVEDHNQLGKKRSTLNILSI